MWREAKQGKPLPLVAVVEGAIVMAGLVFFAVLFIVDRELLARLAPWSLLVIFILGAALALAASIDGRGTGWAELGRSLLVAGLLAFVVWLVGDLRQPVEERSALQVTLGLQHEMSGVDLHKKDLSGFNLAGKDMEGADLEGAQLDHATLVRTNLAGADLEDADLSEAKMEHTVLVGANLSTADLHDVEADKAEFRGARLMETDLEGAELSGADLRGACLAEASLVEASLPDARLKDAALTGTDLKEAGFWLDLRQAYLGQVGLDGAQHVEEARWPPAFAKRAEELAAPDGTGSPVIVRVPPRGAGSGRVASITDGDTVLLTAPSGRVKVRMVGIDAPAVGETGGGAARKMLEKLLPQNAPVSYVYDQRRLDKFRRHLLYLFTPGGELVNQLMVERGAAVAHVDPPSKHGASNRRYAAQLNAAEVWARQHARGLWAGCPS